METPEKIPLEEALARGLVPCTTCSAKGPGVKRAGDGFACEACAAKKGGRGALWGAAVGGLLLIGWAAWLLQPAPVPGADPFVAEMDSLLKQGKFAALRDRIVEKLPTTPQDPGLHLFLGHAHFNLGHVEDALGEFRKAAELDPSVAAPAETWTGICLQRLGYAAEALPLLQKPILPDALDERRRLALAEALLDLERYDDALALLPAKSRDPRSIFNRHRGLRYGGKTKEADALLDSLDPKEAWTFRMTLKREAGDFDGARALLAANKAATDPARFARAELTLALEEGNLTRLLDLAGDPDGLWFRAVGLLLAGNLDEAKLMAEEFLRKTDPKLASLRQYRTMMLLLADRMNVPDFEAEVKRVHRFQAPDYCFFLALLSGDKAWAVKGLETSPGHNFPYHALKRLAGR